MASLTSLVPCKHYYEHRIGGHDSDTITGKNDKRHKTFIVFLTLNKNFQTMDVENERSSRYFHTIVSILQPMIYFFLWMKFEKFVVYPFVVLFMSLLSKPSRLFEKQCLCLRILLFICTQATFYCFSIVVFCSITTSYSHQMSPYCFVILFWEQI